MIALALAIKLLIPAGYMTSMVDGQIAVIVCPGAASARDTVPIAFDPMSMAPPSSMAEAMAMSGPHAAHTGADEHGSQHQGQPEAPCAFAGFSTPTLPGADPALLLVAILFIMAAGTRIVASSSIAPQPRLRPPLRGPPALA